MASAKKPDIHREWFRIVTLSGRKSCPSCGNKLANIEPESDRAIWSWGQYRNARWYTVKRFCKTCWPEIEHDLIDHMNDCGCEFELVGYGGIILPDWFSLSCTTNTNQS